jgi:carbonic anhydrase/acetyltransferase-like protein (isoleucine patch superfamily)
MPLYAYGERRPRLDEPVWIADTATVIGNVHLRCRASVFFGAVLRGDNDLIEIGADSNVQDNAVLHTDPGVRLVLGRGVTVGHQAMLHGCEIGADCLIGIGAVILNHARVAPESLVGAGTLIPEGKTFPPRSLILGTPGKAVRTLDDAEVERIRDSARNYVAKWQAYLEGLRPL